MSDEHRSPRWTPPPRPPERRAPRGRLAVLAVAQLFVMTLVIGGTVFAVSRAWRDDDERPTRAAPAPTTTADQSPGSTAPAGDPFGDLGGLLGGNAEQLAQCFADDVG